MRFQNISIEIEEAIYFMHFVKESVYLKFNFHKKNKKNLGTYT